MHVAANHRAGPDARIFADHHIANHHGLRINISADCDLRGLPPEVTDQCMLLDLWDQIAKARRRSHRLEPFAAQTASAGYRISTTGAPVAEFTSSTRAITFRATANMLLPPGASSPCDATGLPVSPPMRICGSISISPRNGTPKPLAMCAPSPWPNTSMRPSQCGQLK